MVFTEIIHMFKSFVQLKPVRLDDGFDQANRYFMVAYCLLAGLVLTFTQQFGSAIKCVSDGAEVFPSDYIEEYCWTQGLYTIKEAYNIAWPDEVPYPGIRPLGISCLSTVTLKNGSRIPCPKEHELKPLQRVHHIWYQFVPFYFWLCSVLFYLPYAVFRKWCGIYELKPMFGNLLSQINSPEDQKRAIDNVSRWLYIRLNSYMNSRSTYVHLIKKHSMFYAHVSVKLLYLTVSSLCFFCTDKIFEIGRFATYGYDWLMSLPGGKDHIIMDKLFPKMVACEVPYWSQTGGSSESHMCVLPLNVAVQYFFCIFWFFLIMVNTTNCISVFVTVYRMIFIREGYFRFLRSSLLQEEDRYEMVWDRVGTSGRSILQILVNHCNPKEFEDIMEITCSLLIASFRKQQRRKSRVHNTFV